MALITFVPLAWSAWASLFEDRYLVLPGLLGAAFCAVTVYCTAMIYASLRSVQAWHTPLTPLCYLMFSAAGGLILASFFGFAGAGSTVLVPALAVPVTIAAWIAKLFWRHRMRTLRPISTPETATGLGSIGRVRLFERPHVNENYLTREMGFKIARKHAAKLSAISFLLGGAVPVLLLLILLLAGAEVGISAALIGLIAACCHVAGVLMERWLFFAEARHSVMNYYGG